MELQNARILQWFRDSHPDKFDSYLDHIHPHNIENCADIVESLEHVQIPRNAEGKFKVEIVKPGFAYPLVSMLNEKYGDEITEIVVYQQDRFKALAIWRGMEFFGDENVRIINYDYFDWKENRRAHVVINQHCEEMQDILLMRDYYEFPERTLLVLQSRDKGKNSVKSVQELSYKNQINELHGSWKRIASGTANKYIQYNAIGKWI